MMYFAVFAILLLNLRPIQVAATSNIQQIGSLDPTGFLRRSQERQNRHVPQNTSNMLQLDVQHGLELNTAAARLSGGYVWETIGLLLSHKCLAAGDAGPAEIERCSHNIPVVKIGKRDSQLGLEPTDSISILVEAAAAAGIPAAAVVGSLIDFDLYIEGKSQQSDLSDGPKEVQLVQAALRRLTSRSTRDVLKQSNAYFGASIRMMLSFSNAKATLYRRLLSEKSRTPEASLPVVALLQQPRLVEVFGHMTAAAVEDARKHFPALVSLPTCLETGRDELIRRYAENSEVFWERFPCPGVKEPEGESSGEGGDGKAPAAGGAASGAGKKRASKRCWDPADPDHATKQQSERLSKSRRTTGADRARVGLPGSAGGSGTDADAGESEPFDDCGVLLLLYFEQQDDDAWRSGMMTRSMVKKMCEEMRAAQLDAATGIVATGHAGGASAEEPIARGPCLTPSSVALESGAHESMEAFGAKRVDGASGKGLRELFMPDVRLGPDESVHGAYTRAIDGMQRRAYPWAALLDNNVLGEVLHRITQFNRAAARARASQCGAHDGMGEFERLQRGYVQFVLNQLVEAQSAGDSASGGSAETMGSGAGSGAAASSGLPELTEVQMAEIAVRISMLGIQAVRFDEGVGAGAGTSKRGKGAGTSGGVKAGGSSAKAEGASSAASTKGRGWFCNGDGHQGRLFATWSTGPHDYRSIALILKA